jgi:hypothetical protein
MNTYLSQNHGLRFRNTSVRLHKYAAGRATFIVRGDVVRNRSLDEYKNMYADVTDATRDPNDQHVPIMYESAWSSIFRCTPNKDYNTWLIFHTNLECYD